MIRPKKEIGVFPVTSPKKNRVGRSLLNFYFLSYIIFIIFPDLKRITTDEFFARSYIMKRGLFGPVT